MLRRASVRLFFLRAGLLACLVPGRPNIGRSADASSPSCQEWGAETLTRIDQDFWLPDRRLYSEEGHLDQPPRPPVTMMWGAGVALSALSAAARQDPKHYSDRLVAFIDALDAYWTDYHHIGGYDVQPAPKANDRYYDDNAWMVLALAEAWETTHRPGDLARAEATQRFVLSGEDDRLGGGIYWHEPDRATKNTCVNAPAIVGALRLYQLTKKPAYLDDARRLYRWTCAHLQGADGLFADNIALDGRVDGRRYSYNSGLMIRAASLLHAATGEAAFLDDAHRIARAADARWVIGKTGAIWSTARFAHLLLEGFLALHDEDHDPHWLDVERNALIFVHNEVRDAHGHYGDHWETRPAAPRMVFPLLDQASAARAFWVAAGRGL